MWEWGWSSCFTIGTLLVLWGLRIALVACSCQSHYSISHGLLYISSLNHPVSPRAQQLTHM